MHRELYTGRQLLCFFAAAVLALGCTTDEDTGPLPGGEERRLLLSSVGTRVILPTLRDFADAADALAAAVDAHAAAVEGDGDTAATLTAARAAFDDAMAAWQRAELMQVGPAALGSEMAGGLGLRDRIYGYPSVASCRVDQALVAKAYAEDDFFDTALTNAYGLDALAYLLWWDAADSTCGERAAIIADGSWDKLSADAAALSLARAQYAARVASGLAARGVELRDAWERDGGDFVTHFATRKPGGGGGGGGDDGADAGSDANTGEDDFSVYGSPHEAVDALFAGMFYLDAVVKDAKLADPAGISETCTEDTCPELIEDAWSGRSGAHLQQNLAAFQEVLLGGPLGDADAYGFDDLLREVGAASLADELVAATAAAVTACDALDADLAASLQDDHDAVVLAHTRVKAITDLMKTQLVTILGVRVPDDSAGDAD